MTRVSDPNAWCFAELDGSPLAGDLNRLLADDELDPAAVDRGDPGDGWAQKTLLIDAMESLAATLTTRHPVVPSRQLLGPVLDIWDMADRIDPAAAAPLEALLSHLKLRTHTTVDEVAAALADVRRVLVGGGNSVLRRKH